MEKLLTVLVISLGLISCATTDYSKLKPSEVAAQITVTDSEFDTHKTYYGPEVKDSVSSGTMHWTKLAAVVNKKTGYLTYALTTTWEYHAKSWVYFSSADLIGGLKLQSSQVKRDVVKCQNGYCTFREVISSVVPAERLHDAKEGMKIRYLSREGHLIVNLPQVYIDGFLQGIRALGLDKAYAPVYLNETLDLESAQALLAPGKNTINGSAFFRQSGGALMTCAGLEVLLIPKTLYASERMNALYNNSIKGYRPVILKTPQFIPNDPQYLEHSKSATCNARGEFRFENIADGDFYVVTNIVWMAGAAPQGGALMDAVSVKGGQVAEVFLSP